MTKLRAALAAILAALTLAACAPSGDPHEPNPLDFEAALPCIPDMTADGTIVIEVVNRQAQLVAAQGVLLRRDAVSITGRGGQGGYAIHLDRPGALPDEITVTAPFCWNIRLRPEVDEAIVKVTANYPLVSGERLVCYKLDTARNVPIMSTYDEHVAGGMMGLYGEVTCTPSFTRRAA